MSRAINITGAYLLVVSQEKGRTALVGVEPLPLAEANLEQIRHLSGVTDSFMPKPHYLNICFNEVTDWGMDLEEPVIGILETVVGPDILLLGADFYNLFSGQPHVLTVEHKIGGGKIVDLTRYAYEPGAEPYDRNVLEAIVAKLNRLAQVSVAHRLLPDTVRISFKSCFSWNEERAQEAVQQAIEEVVDHKVTFTG